MKLTAFIITIVCLWAQALYPIVILVHGSFSAKASNGWWMPQGKFFQELEAQAQFLGHQVVPFCWSGVPTETEIIAASSVLAKLISSYPPEEEKILIGHSHGGNVILSACQILYSPAMLASSFDLHPTVRAMQTKKYTIDKVYLLGTPVDTKKFYPHMQVIGQLINFYSEGDLIQPVAGFYERCFLLHEHIANIEVLVRKSGAGLIVKPGHSQLHDHYIGRWLLHIPHILSQAMVGNFDHFGFGKNAQILFDELAEPVYFEIK